MNFQNYSAINLERCFVLWLLVALSSSINLYSQCTELPITTNCTYYNDVCTTTDFLNSCNSTSGWSPSHGTPQISKPNKTGSFATMVADGNGGEGMFIPYNFVNGQSYTITITFTTAGVGLINCYAASGLTQSQKNYLCQGSPPPNIPAQKIGQVASTNTGTFTFPAFVVSGGPIGGYSQFWMYTTYNGGASFVSNITNVQICLTCDYAAPTGLTTIDNETTLSWNPVSQAPSYDITIQDQENSNVYQSNLTSTTPYVFYCPKSPGDNVSYIVAVGCPASGGYGLNSAEYSFNEPSAPAIPVNLNYNTSTNMLTWSAVAGATGYTVQVEDITHPNGDEFVTDNTNSASNTTLELTAGNIYQVAVNASTGCIAGAYSSWYTFTATAPCPTPTISSATNPGGSPYEILVTWQAISGVSTYNLDFTVAGTSNTTSITGITGTSYTFTSPTYTAYTISIQGVCSTSMSPFNPYNSGEPVESSIGKGTLINGSASDNNGDNGNITSQFKLFPVPSSSSISILYSSSQIGKLEITITNSLGIVVMRKSVSSFRGQNNYSLDVGQLSKGVYFIKLIDGNNIHSDKIVVLK